MGAGKRYRVGDVIASKYRLETLLGEGGMGSVWRAFNIQLEAPVAIKVIRGDVDRDLLTERLRQEARAAAKLGHPAIVRVFDVGESEFGDPFIVMELLSGQSLGAMLTAQKRIPATRAVQLLLPVVDALSVAHAKGIIHRDLKPDNVFIAVDNEQLQPKLVDFGIVKLSGQAQEQDRNSFPDEVGTQPARRVGRKITQIGTVIGSPQYMSPEQARGREDLDHRTDIWSLCVVLYEAVAGHVPFTNPNYNELLHSIQVDEPTAFSGDAALGRVIALGLAKEPSARFQSMAELGQALAGWLLLQGVSEDACGTSLEAKWLARTSDSHARRRAAPAFQQQRWLTRNRLLVAGAVLLGALTAGFVVNRSAATTVASASSASGPAPQAEARPAVSAAPSPEPNVISASELPIEALEPVAKPGSTRRVVRGGGGRRAPVAAPVTQPTPQPAVAPAPASNRAARDLISPY